MCLEAHFPTLGKPKLNYLLGLKCGTETETQTSRRVKTRTLGAKRKSTPVPQLADVTRGAPTATTRSQTRQLQLSRGWAWKPAHAPQKLASRFPRDSRGNRARQNEHFRRCAQEAEVRLPVCQRRGVTPRSWNLGKSFSLHFLWRSRASPLESGSAESEARDEHDVRRHAAHRFYLRVHGSARRGWEWLFIFWLMIRPRGKGRILGPGSLEPPREKSRALLGDGSHVLYSRESYLQDWEGIQCGIHCQVSPVQGRFHLRVCGDNFESCHSCFGWTSVVKH